MTRPVLQALAICVLGLAVATPAFGQSVAQCQSGFVWREAWDGDTVCVTPETRAQTLQDNRLAASRVQPGGGINCLSGYVWRGARDGDAVCVTPETRAQAAQDNGLASSRVAGRVGGSVGSQMSGVGVGVGARASDPGSVVVQRPQPGDLPTQGERTSAPRETRATAMCGQYARGAVSDFRNAQARPRCRIGPDGRWHDNYRAHYDWCIRVSEQEQRSEYAARDRHLINCGARFTY